MTGYLIGVDAGNTMVKAALFDASGQTLAVAARSSETLQPAPGFVERSPEGLWQAASGAIRDCLEQAGVSGAQVLAVGAAGHGNGLYLLDREGQGLVGIQSMDNRAETLASEIAAAHGDEILSRAQSRPWPAMTPVLLRWMAENRPEIMARAHVALLCKDVIVHGLTGRMGSEVSDLAGAGLLALPALQYDDALLRLYGIEGLRHILPEPAQSDAVVGHVTAAAADATGLAKGTPVVGGLFDVLASTLGAGTSQPGEASIVAGSWSINQVFARALPEKPRALLASVLGRDTWVSCECSPTSAANLEWFVQTFLADEAKATGEDPFALCNRLAAGSDPESDLPVFHPFLYAGPVPGARGGFSAMGAWHSRGDMVRALYEGVAFGHRAHFEILDPDRAFRTATLSGGAAKSQLWAQIFADTLGMTLRLSDCLETGARGAAIAAAIGAGLFDGFDAATGAMARHTEEITPDPAAQAQLDARYRRWCAYRDALGAAWAPPQVLAFEPRETQERTSHG
ncbi:FGGY-family carbohydrate kinase [Salipiger bermudensis]|uniref:FGGY-family carbohydrate kinase n=1 Tax=Salipiger bermudensis TaxID=344736 RepID=UPI001A90B7D9|nr:FGGY-family carbohydrate kinase [Salipiger bermudensis]MBN9675576.1 carbohydrate kinase [Salipiger bermudensis]